MLLLFFGTDEFSSGVAVNRKVTLMARTLSDLTSQNISVTDAQFTNFFNASMCDHDALFVDAGESHDHRTLYRSATLVARVQWSKGAAPRAAGNHGGDPDRASGRRHLSDLQRGQIRLCPDGRLCPEDSDHAERLHLYPPAPVDLRDVRHVRSAPRPDIESRDRARSRHDTRSFSETKKAAPSGAAFDYFGAISRANREGAPWKIAYPAARRLSAEDLPERRSATIS